ncbi:hypothetical protein MMC10_011024 [Thelotrema lepadinum]|nr:hypothetical protein [Thelotrema lepadinum]
MSSRYIPPALRRQQKENTEPSKEAGSEKSAHPDDALPTRKLEDLKIDTRKLPFRDPREVDPNALAIEEIHMHFGGPAYLAYNRSTLNDSIEHPKQLSYTVLFKDANPRWASDHIIFAKTNISFLPGYTEAFINVSEHRSLASEHPEGEEKTPRMGTEGTEGQKPGAYEIDISEDLSPIPVFAEEMRKGSFLFTGWFRLQKISFLHPHSQDLVRMLAQKWDLRDKRGRAREVRRDKEAWEKSLKLQWAVIKMTKIEGEDGKGLDIKRYDDPKRVREEALKEKFGDAFEENEKRQETEKVAEIDTDSANTVSNEGEMKILEGVDDNTKEKTADPEELSHLSHTSSHVE